MSDLTRPNGGPITAQLEPRLVLADVHLDELRARLDKLEQRPTLDAFLPLLTRLAAFERFSELSVAELLLRLRDAASVLTGEIGWPDTPASAFTRPADEQVPAVLEIARADYNTPR